MTMQFTIRAPGENLSRHAKAVEADRRMCRRIVTLTMPLFLVTTAFRRLLGAAGIGGSAAAGQRLSFYAEARASAYATIPFMFMG